MSNVKVWEFVQKDPHNPSTPSKQPLKQNKKVVPKQDGWGHFHTPSSLFACSTEQSNDGRWN